MCFSLIGLYLSFLLTSLWGRFFYDYVSSNSMKQVCITFSALVHYFLLVYFCITVAQSLLLYVQLVMVLGTKNILHYYQLRAGLVCWSKFLKNLLLSHCYCSVLPHPLMGGHHGSWLCAKPGVTLMFSCQVIHSDCFFSKFYH